MNIDDKDYIIVFHGASNDKGQDPDKKTIRAPSPEHPFFVTKNLDIAVEYSRAVTASDGRLAEDYRSNSRVYVLRLDKNKFKPFSFFTQANLRRLSKFYTREFIDYMARSFGDRESSLMNFSNNLSYTIVDKYNEVPDSFKSVLETFRIDARSLAETLKSKDRLSFIRKATDSVIDLRSNVEAIAILNLLPEMFSTTDELVEVLQAILDGEAASKYGCDPSSILGRRAIKAALFSHVLDLGFNAVYELDTMTSNDSNKIDEIGLLSMDPIVDVVPFPIDAGILETAVENYKYRHWNNRYGTNHNSKGFLREIFNELDKTYGIKTKL